MFEITPLIQNGTWTANMPSILEGNSQGTRFDFTNADDPELLRLLRRKRVILIQLTGSTVGELGLGRGREGTDASDIYFITIKSGNNADAKAIYNNLRDIIIKIPVTEYYNRLEIVSLEQFSRRGSWWIQFELTAYTKGKVRQVD